jgi:PiT family inorganic phosphate transporter
MGLVVSTVVGFGLAFIIMIIIYWLFRHAQRPTAGRLFQRLQIVSAGFLAFSHGSNDGQKFMGVFTLALVLGGVIPNFHVQTWVVFLCSAVMAVGAGIGGWRVTKTKRLTKAKLEPVNAFVAETAASISILASSVFGIPLSTTHTIGTAIMGVGVTNRLSAVNWGVCRQIVITWLLTFPACLILGYLFTWLFKLIF